MNTLILGINPSSVQRIRKNSAYDRLQKWILYLDVDYTFFNVIENTGKYHKNMIDYDRLIRITEKHDKTIALGKFVSHSLSLINKQHFTLPHPSPLNRLLNDSNFELIKLEECRRYLSS
jgi:hypothetical protein